MGQHTVNYREQIQPLKLVTQALSTEQDKWSRLSAAKRNKANERKVKIAPFLNADNLNQALKTYQGKESVATLRRWIAAFQEQGIMGLVAGNKGKVVKTQDWHARAIALYNSPNKPTARAVALDLSSEGFDCSYYQVNTYFKSLPAQFGAMSKSRVGKHTFELTEKTYKIMDYSQVAPGDIYQGDGHTIDVYIAHPNTGKPYRPELTVFIDVASRKIVGWHLSEAESSLSTIYALSHAIESQNHIPLTVHVDNGSGFKSKMMADESIGFYNAVLGNRPRFAIAGRPTGKGIVERFFGTLKSQFHKGLVGYCGMDRDSKDKSDWYNLALKREAEILSFTQYVELLKQYLVRYNNQAHKGIQKQCPNQVWSNITLFESDLSVVDLLKPKDKRKVSRGQVKFHNRIYRHPDLLAYNHKEVVIEYSLHSFESIRILDNQHALICTATMPEMTNYGGKASVLEEMKSNRLKGRLKRGEAKVKEIQAQEMPTIDGQIVEMQNIGAMDALPIVADDDLIDIDISQLSTE